MAVPLLRLFALLLVLGVHASFGHREGECIEVGYARSAGSLLHQGYEATKKAVLERWATEDKEKKPYKLSPLLVNVTRTGQLLEDASKVIVDMIRKTRVGKRCPGDWLLKGLEKHVVPLINLDKELAEEMGLVMSFRCMVGSPYPNVDGSCINQESPDLGSVGSKFLRLQPAAAGKDGFTIRSSVNDGKKLPSARTVAEVLRKHLKKPTVYGIFTEWAHFVQRDTFSIPESPLADNIDCCATPEAEDCEPIQVDKNDALFSTRPCINFRRSARAQAILGHRETLSTVSTFLDASPVYGHTDKVAFTRKTGYFGYLKAPGLDEDDEDADDKKVEKKSEDTKCGAPESLKGCFKLSSGDWIEGLKLLLLLEHNRIADLLAELNPHFDDALLYNEARRMTIAQYNHITYGEYLPILMGDELVKKHSLNPGSTGPGSGYIKEVNPGVLANFASSSYRNPAMYTEWKAEWGPSELAESTHYDSIREDDYHDYLAMDVQRSRDQGVVGYLVWRRFCDNDKQYNTWEDLERGLSKELVAELKVLYDDEMDDIDPQVAVFETPMEGAVIGKTLSCLVADQFARLKTGNRLFWEHETSMLTVEQKAWIKQSSLARLLCNNLPVENVPTNAFLPVSETNPLLSCSELPALTIEAWKDTALIEKMKQLKEGKAAEGSEAKESTSRGSEL
ncbi:chorion peroxidase-like [Macrobrachium nipponense]|uniref:chorion peroxidase-like n=1 Tax=Macrobrachium nipponense TaxID=159736 RepID=UPI0030C83F99